MGDVVPGALGGLGADGGLRRGLVVDELEPELRLELHLRPLLEASSTSTASMLMNGSAICWAQTSRMTGEMTGSINVDCSPQDLMADWRVSRTRCSVSSDAFPRRSTRDESMPIMLGTFKLWLDSGKSCASALQAPTLTGGGTSEAIA